MEESVDLHEEASKENKQTVPINLSAAEEQQSKDEVEIEKFLQDQKWEKHSIQDLGRFVMNAWKKFCESLKESKSIPAIELDLLLFKNFISVCSQNEYELGTLSSFQVRLVI